jgi:hypothetical protein
MSRKPTDLKHIQDTLTPLAKAGPHDRRVVLDAIESLKRSLFGDDYQRDPAEPEIEPPKTSAEFSALLDGLQRWGARHAPEVWGVCMVPLQKLRRFVLGSSGETLPNAHLKVYGPADDALNFLREHVRGQVDTQGHGNTALLLDLSQIAALVHREKRSMENYKRRKNDPLPDSDFPGGAGKRDFWQWSTIRPWLSRNFNTPIPEQFPDIYRRR